MSGAPINSQTATTQSLSPLPSVPRSTSAATAALNPLSPLAPQLFERAVRKAARALAHSQSLSGSVSASASRASSRTHSRAGVRPPSSASLQTFDDSDASDDRERVADRRSGIVFAALTLADKKPVVSRELDDENDDETEQDENDLDNPSPVSSSSDESQPPSPDTPIVVTHSQTPPTAHVQRRSLNGSSPLGSHSLPALGPLAAVMSQNIVAPVLGGDIFSRFQQQVVA